MSLQRWHKPCRRKGLSLLFSLDNLNGYQNKLWYVGFLNLLWGGVVSALLTSIAFAEEPPSIPETKWQVLDQTDQLTIFKGEATKDGVLPFKAEAKLSASVVQLTQAMFDYENKVTWAPKLMYTKVIRIIKPAQEFVFQERYETPWPAKHRLFNMRGWLSSDRPGHIVFHATNANDPNLNEDCCITSDVQYTGIELEQIDGTTTKATFVFLGHLGGWIPVWLNNMLQKVWPKKFLQGLEAFATGPKVRKTKDFNELAEHFTWLKESTAH